MFGLFSSAFAASIQISSSAILRRSANWSRAAVAKSWQASSAFSTAFYHPGVKKTKEDFHRSTGEVCDDHLAFCRSTNSSELIILSNTTDKLVSNGDMTLNSTRLTSDPPLSSPCGSFTTTVKSPPTLTLSDAVNHLVPGTAASHHPFRFDPILLDRVLTALYTAKDFEVGRGSTLKLHEEQLLKLPAAKAGSPATALAMLPLSDAKTDKTG